MAHPEPEVLRALHSTPRTSTRRCARTWTAAPAARALSRRSPAYATRQTAERAGRAHRTPVRARVLDRCAGERSRPGPVARSRPPSARRRVPLWLAGVAAALTLVAGIGLGRLTVERPHAPRRRRRRRRGRGRRPHRPRQRRPAWARRGGGRRRQHRDRVRGAPPRSAIRLGFPRGVADQRRREADGGAWASWRGGDDRSPSRSRGTCSTRGIGSSTSRSSPTTATRPTPGSAWPAVSSPDARRGGGPRHGRPGGLGTTHEVAIRDPGWRRGAAVAAAVHDLVQRRHAILRNFPVIGHPRFLLEALGPELRQYIVAEQRRGAALQPRPAPLGLRLGQAGEQLLRVRHRQRPRAHAPAT